MILNTRKRNIYRKRTHSCEKNWSLLCDSKTSEMWQKKQRRCRMRGRKKFPHEKTRDRRYFKNAQRRKITLKQLTQPRNNDDICEYGSYVYMMIIIIGLLWARKKMQHEKQTDVRLAKRLGFIQRLRFSNLGLNYRDTSTARNRA